ncbi:hypothetical protein AB1K32_25240 [Metabacillus dongyingensis]|uniref:hypothetical protein n=1 Tax=Metabacillus dongyingensis TaxID=2874282 RepID=UPI003B8BD34A
MLNKVSPLLIEVKGSLIEEWIQLFVQQSGHLMEYRAGIFCGEVEVVLSNSIYGIEFLNLNMMAFTK